MHLLKCISVILLIVLEGRSTGNFRGYLCEYMVCRDWLLVCVSGSLQGKLCRKLELLRYNPRARNAKADG